ncbi:hypothetical protein HanRHA438_Chr01g0013141 [Helianthus annuus]|nr:hypothetical protein HanRHA438_Chr01g0013141 [Helianthus annuus]
MKTRQTPGATSAAFDMKTPAISNMSLSHEILVLQMTMEDGFKNSTATEELHGDGS